ncbi:ABC-2 transporter permease [Clostridium sp. AL.422]|uniref:ABC-2 transporter permease n=1 Tax=Clostridium TaxID=1485 RepID=UPI00293DC99C|nr:MULTISPECIES: ABC-2 transporter permease [unclassified Clostridium]MDV4151943.1 ABC-2 transporter permease [Clostridium sp. AL.422]
MLQLIKKDLLVALKIKSIKNAAFIFAIVLILLQGIIYPLQVILPIMITYIIVMNSFYYDNLNNSESYILSMPNKREDVVYSKYILVVLVLVLSNILMYILFGNNIFFTSRLMVLQDTVASFYTVLISFAIIIPLTFKLGYKVTRIFSPIITIVLSYNFIFKYHYLIPGNSLTDSFFMNTSYEIGVLLAKYFNYVTHDYGSRAISIYNILSYIIIGLIFIISMFIALKAYKNKDIV